MNPTSEAAAIVDLADRCVQCGLCLPHCPTYAESAQEAQSPRGRIVLAKALAVQRVSADAAAFAIDQCLGCRACERVCPAKVDYGRLLLDARRRVRDRSRIGWRQRGLEWLLVRPQALEWTLRAAGWLRRVPGLGRRIPTVSTPPRAGLHAATATRRGSVLLFEGCVARRLDGATHRDAIAVLNRLGWDVQVPGHASCCGSLHAHAGDAESATALRDQLARRLTESKPNYVLSCSSGCIEALQQAAGAIPARELMQFLAADEGLSSLPWRGGAEHLAIHVPCTQRNVLRAPNATATVLRHVPGLQLHELTDTGCCGAAGSLRLTARQRASRFAAPLLRQLAGLSADALLSNNIGCRTHLELELAAGGQRLRCAHPITVLARYLP